MYFLVRNCCAGWAVMWNERFCPTLDDNRKFKMVVIGGKSLISCDIFPLNHLRLLETAEPIEIFCVVELFMVVYYFKFVLW